MKTGAGNITVLLEKYSSGDQKVLDELMPAVYAELKKIARGYLKRERGDHTLQPTALLHEAFLRFSELNQVKLQNRTHFFAIAASLMRRILINHARDRKRLKRGGGQVRVSFIENLHWQPHNDEQLLALDVAMEKLAKENERQAKVVELRCFGGLSIEEVATVLELSPATVKRDWTFARAWLFRELNQE